MYPWVMAQDRFIEFKAGKAPTRDKLRMLLEDYFGDFGGTTVTWETDRFVLLLPGRTSFPFKRLEPDSIFTKAHEAEAQDRWIEVYIKRGEPLDVITRRQDELTNAIADGIAATIARYWEGTVEDD